MNYCRNPEEYTETILNSAYAGRHSSRYTNPDDNSGNKMPSIPVSGLYSGYRSLSSSSSTSSVSEGYCPPNPGNGSHAFFTRR